MYFLQITRTRPLFRQYVLFGFLVCCWGGVIADGSPLDFRMPRNQGSGEVGLADFHGQIVVLDFFAYWCAPCRDASPLIEEGIQHYYHLQKGNPFGIPVRVIGVNVDASNPVKTRDFIRESGLSMVLDDPDGEVFRSFGGKGIPLIVIVDNTGSKPDMIYSRAGFESIEQLRMTIDGIIPREGTCLSLETGATAIVNDDGVIPMCLPEDPSCLAGSTLLDTKVPGIKKQDISISSATMQSDDVAVYDTVAEYNFRGLRHRFTLNLLHGFIGLDFVPFDTVLQSQRLENKRFGGQASAQVQIADPLVFTIGGNLYEGFMDYKSLWLDEYYRQLYGTLPEYKEATPSGYGFASDLRWEYLPGSGFIQGSVSYQYDIVAPAYSRDISSFPPALVRENDEYETITGSASLENVVSRRIRSKLEGLMQKTTDREMRYSAKGSVNVAVIDSVVSRTELAGSSEDPSFRSWSVGSTIEYDWNDKWFLSLTGRYYRDTGQIEIALPGNASAPAVETGQIVLGLRWQGRSAAFKMLAGPYVNNYLEAPADSEFTNLYSDRDWMYYHAAFSYRF